MTHTSLRTFRWVMLGFGLVAGALLLADGDYLLGIVIGGMALLRLGFMLSLARRRRQFRSTADAATGAHPVLRTLARGQFEVAADAIGVPSAELRIEFAKGRSIAEVASTEGVPVETVVAAVVADASAKVDRAVADGQTPSVAGARIKGRLPQWATRLVNGHRGDFRAGGVRARVGAPR
jgi:hypothetical protein